jgi:septal ring factor EnvC (AmiA/AmiB activator)
MGSFGGGKASTAASAMQKKQLKAQQQVNAAEIARLNAQTASLGEEKARAQAEADKLSEENRRKKDLIARRNAGRSSLIGPSGELGVVDKLG